MKRKRGTGAGARAAEVQTARFLRGGIGALANATDLNCALKTLVAELAHSLDAAHIFLFRHASATQQLRLELTLIEGRVRWGMSGEEVPLWVKPFPDDITPAWEIMCSLRGLFTPDLCPIPPEEFAWPGAFEYAQRFELSDMAHIVLFAGEETVGSIGLGFRNGKKLRLADRPLVEAAAQQAAILIRMLDLAKASQDAAVAREREQAAKKRAEELAKANVALRDTLSHLASRPDPNAFLSQVLMEASRQLNADAGHLVILDEANGRVVTVANSAGDQLLPLGAFPPEVLVSEVGAIPVMAAAGGPRIFDLSTEQHLFMRGTVDWHKEFGTRTVLTVPMILGKKMVGFLGFAFRQETALSPEKAELLMALAQQAALATTLIRLSEEEREVALSREREQAAQQRAAELGKANAVLRRVNERLAHETDYRCILGLLLAELSFMVGSVGGGIFTFDADTHVLRFVLGFDDGQIVNELVGHPHGHPDRPGDARMFLGWTDLTTALKQQFIKMPPNTASRPSNEWHFARRHRLLVRTPLVANGKPIGLLCLAFPNEEPLDSLKLEFFNSAAQQATLALQLSHLAEQVEQASVMSEREQAARLKAEELAKANAILTMRDKLLKLVAEASRELIQAPDLIAGIYSLLRRMGESTGLSRVLLYLEREGANGESEHYILAEWCAPGIANHRSLGVEVIPNSIVKPFLEWVEKQSGFWLDMQKVEEPMRSTFAPLKLVSAGCAPVMVGGEYAGVIAFDDCAALRTDDFAYVDAFLAVANFIGAALQRESGQKALVAEQHERASMEAKAAHEREAAIFQERARLAGQIHDTLAQGFTGTLLHLEALRVRTERGERVTVKEFENVRKIAALGLAEARRSALAIRPRALDGRDLATALEQLTERSTVPGLLDCHWSLCGIPRPLSSIAEEALLNIAHEAVNNAIRHADAAKIEIILSFDSDGVSLTVRDDGIGFDASESRHRGHTLGLCSMRERAFNASGALKVVSQHGEGTTIKVNLSNA